MHAASALAAARVRSALARLALAALRIRLTSRRAPSEPGGGPARLVITPGYQALNRQMHAEREGYGVQGQYHVPQVRLLAQLLSRDILDYGCGKRLIERGLGFPIQNYDPGVLGLEQPPRPANFVVCLDVLEHIEPDCLDAVLADLVRVTLRAGYFTVSTVPARKSLPDGRNAHLIVEGHDWWERTLRRFFRIRLRLDQGDHATFLAQPPRGLTLRPPGSARRARRA